MKFCRIEICPPYVFATVDQLKRELRREGRDVIDLGFGNPDIPSPAIAVEKLREAAPIRATTGTPRAAASISCARPSPSTTSESSASARPGDADRERRSARRRGSRT